VASLAVFYPYARRQFRIANARQEWLDEYKRARFVAEHEAKELLRLAAAYEEFLDWAVILGAVLHRPGGAPPAAAPDTVDLGAVPVPEAVAVSEAVADPRQRLRLAAVIGRRHFHRSWASGLLDSFTRASMAELKYEKGRNPGDPDPQPEVDREARRRLRDDLMSGRPAAAFVRKVRADVAVRVGQTSVGELFSGLCPPHDGGPERFLTEPVAPPDPAAGGPESFSWPWWRPGQGPTKDETTTWAPASVKVPHGVEVCPVAVSANGAAVLLWVGRLDVSMPGRWPALRMAQEPHRGPEDPDSDLTGIG
jgi:hypothetical protein